MTETPAPITNIRQQQAVMTYFAPTVVPVFKVRYLPSATGEILTFFQDLKDSSMASAVSNLGCWHTGYESLTQWPELLEPVARSLAAMTWQCLVQSAAPQHATLDTELWFADYAPGGFAQAHNHGHDALSFCWYLDVTEGGSDFVVHEHGLDIGRPVERSQTSIPVATGDVLIFPGFLTHSVPETPARRRVIAGNVRGPRATA